MLISKIIKPLQLNNKFNTKLYYRYFNQNQQSFDQNKDYYGILNLSKNATDSEIKRSFYKLAKQFHPDVNKGYETKFKQINEAYQVLSNQNTRKQYDSARLWNQRWSQMGSKASEGNYSYSEYQNIYYNMSQQEREQFTKEAQARLRRFGFIFAGFFIFWLFFSRTPHKAYTQMNNTLIPIDPVAAFQYPQNMPQNYPNQYYGHNQAPYGGGQGPYGGGQSYGSHYPQAQYLQNNNYSSTYVDQPVRNAYQQAPYQASQQAYQAQRSQYTIDRPQPHQPYPNSPYAQRPIQSNYRPDYKPEAPKGMED